MDFNAHSNVTGHAILSPSDYHWINYTEDKLDRVFHKRMDTLRGAEMHDLAQRLITLRVKLPDNGQTLNMYVNDAIGYRMTPEQTLYYSANCFGKCDAIGYSRGTLRIHDLKTGENPGSMHQLEIYAALFCLEYGFKPTDLRIELRLYQQDQVVVLEASPVDITMIMEKIRVFDRRLKFLRSEVA